jgi:hypothetical protein
MCRGGRSGWGGSDGQRGNCVLLVSTAGGRNEIAQARIVFVLRARRLVPRLGYGVVKKGIGSSVSGMTSLLSARSCVLSSSAYGHCDWA